jgi:hypothetical protein
VGREGCAACRTGEGVAGCDLGPAPTATSSLPANFQDSVLDVVELCRAGRLGPGRRERVGCGGGPSGGSKGESGRHRMSPIGQRT